MTSDDVKPSVLKALQVTGLTKNTAPRLLSDNGPCYISAEIKSFLAKQGIKPVNGRACHPQTQGKIERYHRTMKNVIKLENYYSPEELKRAIAQFVDYYNNHRYHESLNNLTPADVFYGRADMILKERARIKKETMKSRRKNYYQKKHPQKINAF
jgi:transposase InsO family protein